MMKFYLEKEADYIADMERRYNYLIDDDTRSFSLSDRACLKLVNDIALARKRGIKNDKLYEVLLEMRNNLAKDY